MTVTLDPVQIAKIIGAFTVIGSAIFGLCRWIMRQNKQDEDIASLKEEQTLVCYALKACLDGLEQLGANHTVPDAKDRLEKYLNQKAHEQTRRKERK